MTKIGILKEEFPVNQKSNNNNHVGFKLISLRLTITFENAVSSKKFHKIYTQVINVVLFLSLCVNKLMVLSN